MNRVFQGLRRKTNNIDPKASRCIFVLVPVILDLPVVVKISPVAGFHVSISPFALKVISLCRG